MNNIFKHFIPFILALFLSLPATATTMNGCETTAMQGCSAGDACNMSSIIGSDLYVWVDNSSNANFTINGGGATGAVSSWHDLSGNSNDIDQSVAADQPNWDGTKVTFDSVTEYLQRATFTQGTLAQPYTIITVADVDSTNTNQQNVVDSANLTNRTVMYKSVGIPGTHNLFAGSVMVGPAVDSSTHVVIGEFNGASSINYIDGGATTGSGNAGTNSMQGITLGARYNGSGEFLDGSEREIMVVNRLLTKAEKNTIGNCLEPKHGTTWSDIP